MERRKSTTLQMTQGHSSGTIEQNNSITNPPFTRKANLISAPSDKTRRPERPRPCALTRGDTKGPAERTHIRANGKRAARTCTRHPGGHNLANLTRAPSDRTARPGRTPSPGTTKRPNPNERPHRGQHDAPTRTDAHGSKRQTGRPDVHKAPGRSQLSKYGTGALGPNDPTRTDDFTRHDQTTRPERTPSPGATRRAHPNRRTWEQTANGPPGRAQGTRAVATWQI